MDSATRVQILWTRLFAFHIALIHLNPIILNPIILSPALSKLALACSPKAQEAGVQFQVESYQRLKKWYLIPPFWTFSVIRCRSRVKWSNPKKGVGPSPTSRCRSYWKGSLRVPLDWGRQLYLWVKSWADWTL